MRSPRPLFREHDASAGSTKHVHQVEADEGLVFDNQHCASNQS